MIETNREMIERNRAILWKCPTFEPNPLPIERIKKRPALRRTAVCRTALPRPALPRPALPRPALPRPALPRPALPRPALPRPALPRPALPRPALPQMCLGMCLRKAATKSPRLRPLARKRLNYRIPSLFRSKLVSTRNLSMRKGEIIINSWNNSLQARVFQTKSNHR